MSFAEQQPSPSPQKKPRLDDSLIPSLHSLIPFGFAAASLAYDVAMGRCDHANTLLKFGISRYVTHIFPPPGRSFFRDSCKKQQQDEFPPFFALECLHQKLLVIGFPGTHSVSDFVGTDLKCEPFFSNVSCGFVHSGFYSRAQAFPMEFIIPRFGDGWTVLLAGHSLGAAVAQLVAVRVLQVLGESRMIIVSEKRLWCIGFGAPCCGSTDFVEYVDNLVGKKLHDIFHSLSTRQDPVFQIQCVLQERYGKKLAAPLKFVKNLLNFLGSTSFGQLCSLLSRLLEVVLPEKKRWGHLGAAYSADSGKLSPLPVNASLIMADNINKILLQGDLASARNLLSAHQLETYRNQIENTNTSDLSCLTKSDSVSGRSFLPLDRLKANLIISEQWRHRVDDHQVRFFVHIENSSLVPIRSCELQVLRNSVVVSRRELKPTRLSASLSADLDLANDNDWTDWKLSVRFDIEVEDFVAQEPKGKIRKGKTNLGSMDRFSCMHVWDVFQSAFLYSLFVDDSIAEDLFNRLVELERFFTIRPGDRGQTVLTCIRRVAHLCSVRDLQGRPLSHRTFLSLCGILKSSYRDPQSNDILQCLEVGVEHLDPSNFSSYQELKPLWREFRLSPTRRTAVDLDNLIRGSLTAHYFVSLSIHLLPKGRAGVSDTDDSLNYSSLFSAISDVEFQNSAEFLIEQHYFKKLRGFLCDFQGQQLDRVKEVTNGLHIWEMEQLIPVVADSNMGPSLRSLRSHDLFSSVVSIIRSIREVLSKIHSVAVCGPVNTGKSLLVQEVFGYKTGHGNHVNTMLPQFFLSATSIGSTAKLYVIDCPGFNSLDSVAFKVSTLFAKSATCTLVVGDMDCHGCSAEFVSFVHTVHRSSLSPLFVFINSVDVCLLRMHIPKLPFKDQKIELVEKFTRQMSKIRAPFSPKETYGLARFVIPCALRWMARSSPVVRAIQSLMCSAETLTTLAPTIPYEALPWVRSVEHVVRAISHTLATCNHRFQDSECLHSHPFPWTDFESAFIS